MKKKKHIFLHRIKRRKFGELLLSHGSITSEELNKALEIQREDGGLLGDIMVENKFITETEVVRSLSAQYNLPVLRTKNIEVDTDLVKTFPAKFLYMNMILPVCIFGDFIIVVAADIPDDSVIEKLEENGSEVVFYLSSITDISSALLKYSPVSDDERLSYVSLRRRKLKGEVLQTEQQVQPQSKEHVQEEEIGATGQLTEVFDNPSLTDVTAEETALFTSLDNAWESVFDEAEKNLEKDGV